MMHVNTEWVSRDSLALILLALLSEQPRHAYQLWRLIRERKKDFALPNDRALYRTIDHLAKTGLIEPVEVQREGRRPERTIYQITEDGDAAFRGALTDVITTHIDDHPLFSVVVGLLPYMPAGVVVTLLEVRAVALAAEVARLQTHELGLRSLLPRAVLLEVEHTLALWRAELAWVQTVIDDLRAGRLAWDTEQLRQALGTDDQERVFQSLSAQVLEERSQEAKK